MINPIRRQLGNIKRGLKGLVLNRMEHPPQIPQLIDKRNIGKSNEDRPIEAYRIGDGPQKILFAGGIHGNEIGSIKLVRYLLPWIYQNQNRFKEFTFWVVPLINPDGNAVALKKPNYFGGGRIGRFNARNVDMNRNFPTRTFKQKCDWTHGKDYQERTQVFCGKSGGSEPEIQALIKLIKDEEIKVWLMFHTAAADVQGNDNSLAKKLAKIHSEHARYKLYTFKMWKDLKHTGSATEWCNENNIAFLEIEGSTRWGSDWNRQRPAIEGVLKELTKHRENV